MTFWPTTLESQVWPTPSTPVATEMTIIPATSTASSRSLSFWDRLVEDVPQQERGDDPQPCRDDDQREHRRQPPPVGAEEGGDAARQATASRAGGLQRQLEHLFDAHDRVEGHLLADVLGHVVEVAAVALGDDHVGQPGRVGGEHLLLQPADRQHPALQRDLAGHADRVLDRPAAQQRRERRDHRDAGTRAVLRDRARRDVHVELAIAERARLEAELVARGRARTRARSGRTPSSRRRAGR